MAVALLAYGWNDVRRRDTSSSVGKRGVRQGHAYEGRIRKAGGTPPLQESKIRERSEGFHRIPPVESAQADRTRPVIVISTSDGQQNNLMTNGFNMPVRHGGLIGFVVGPWDCSFEVLRDTRECVIAVPSAELAQQVVDVGNISGVQTDKWTRFGLTAIASISVAAPLVAECFANIECRVVDDRLVDDYGLWIVQAEHAWLDESKRGTGEIHHRGDGTFSENAGFIDLRHRMTKWPSLIA
ncbi:flavin reductase family protein [Nocardia beijingensis]|uniref:flavin reductase family protein n=1 Tax=Nocardia beijingensis TaxID=95162 RepID=UPI001893CE59|nr:flavin reductase family protein [Nocardia beijingensis]MBF6469597.1 flavin reductase family protein [Nocardia beijingensis]